MNNIKPSSIKSAVFVRGLTGPADILNDTKPQIALIGRSNVGKSSVINSLVNQKDLARTSSYPGRTQEINLFLINQAFYLVDLPGYGYAKLPGSVRDYIEDMINWYFFSSEYKQKKVILIIDANVGPTKNDLDMLHSLEIAEKETIVVANKIDKIKKSELNKQLQKIQGIIGSHKIIPCSVKDKVGINELRKEMLS
ncbi:MAG: ribosome biogenesis GTP-binding protein YihA/YsxC [Planctomycetes bacterium]|jgi:GTP-binding protein|nr:ribosome biogenesis GTP-binding protein YihA/YsxC [Planctomycetota bacterium]